MRRLEDIRKVAVLGSGMMGTGCAMVFAGAGYDVVLYDVVPEALPKVVPNMRKDLTFLAERGLGRLEDVEPTLDRVSTTLVMEDAVADADFVLEAVIEDMTLKQDDLPEPRPDVRPRGRAGHQHLGHEPHGDSQQGTAPGADHRDALVEPAVPHPPGRGRADRRRRRRGSSS